ncbi:MAG: ABC-2 family transporter protein [Bacillota bacterium]
MVCTACLTRYLTLARYPIAVFRGFSRILFSYILPVAAMANMPTMALIRGSTFTHFLHLVFHGILWYFAGQILWANGVRGYTGASS